MFKSSPIKRNIALLILGVILISTLVYISWKIFSFTQTDAPQPINNALNATQSVESPATVPTVPAAGQNIVLPIDHFYDRVTLKPFGIFITPQNSPVQPERFSGYHTGADAEVTTSEQTIDIPVYAIADGTVAYRGVVNGYGGVIAVTSTVNGETITALYGHIRISSATNQMGDTVHAGDKLAVLGTGFSSETDGERRHLHFALIKGDQARLLGYVQNSSELLGWIDPVSWLKQQQAAEPGNSVPIGP